MSKNENLVLHILTLTAASVLATLATREIDKYLAKQQGQQA